jgi:hypothetical protein
MPVQLVCKCGKQLSIPDEQAGRCIACPGCGAEHQATPSGLKPSHIMDKELRPRASGGKGRVLALLLVFLLLLAGGAGGTWWFFFRAASPPPASPTQEGDDLALIPANAQGFVSTRLAELWNSPAAQKGLKDARQRDPSAPDFAEKMDREIGIRHEEVERLTIVGVDADRQLGWIIARTLTPYSREKVLSRLKDGREQVHQGQRYFVGTGPEGKLLAIHFVGSRVLVAGNEEGVKRCLDFAAGGPVTGPLEPVIALARGTHTAVVGIFPAGGPLETLKANPALKALADLKLFSATMDVSEKATMEGAVKMSSEQEAKKIVKTIEENRRLIQLGLSLAQLEGNMKAKVAAMAAKLLAKSKLAQKGDEITAKAEIDEGSSIAELLMTLPMMNR